NVVESDQGLAIDCDYNADLFDEETISVWVQYYESLLLDAVSDPSRAVDDLSLMTAEQIASLISKLNPTATERTPSDSIVSAFHNRVTQNPDAIAVQMGKDRLSYRELDQRSNQLAR